MSLLSHLLSLGAWGSSELNLVLKNIDSSMALTNALKRCIRNVSTAGYPGLKVKDSLVEISWSKSETSSFHYCWLRDNCRSSSSIHPSTRQKLHSTGHVLAPKAREVSWTTDSPPKLHIKWEKNSINVPNIVEEINHESVFDISWLKANDYTRPPKPLIKPILWTAKEYEAKYSAVEYSSFANTEEGLKQVLKEIRDNGFVFIQNVPTEDYLLQVEKVALRLGEIRESFYGRSWDVKSIANSKNIAYTSLNLGLHMDLMYFENPPGLQFLHCIENSGDGGYSTYLDVYKAVEVLKRESMDHYETLKKVPVTFLYQNDGYHYHMRHPTITDDDLNGDLKVYYAPPFQGPLQADPSLVPAFYEAFNHFESIITRLELIYKRMLKPGDCVIFANQRVLHGRESFSGVRQLRGTFVGWDEFKNKLRVYKMGSNWQ
jgi:gamma-butyrobetaine dioxygenase